MSNEENSAANLYAKMARIMGKLERLKKSGHNDHFNYDFATDSDVADTLRVLLAEENVGLFASMPSYEKIEAGTTKSGIMQYNTIVHLEITLACGDSGALFTTHWHGEAITTDDKGINKAATSAVKYWLLKTFLLSTGDKQDDPDSQSGETGKKQPRQTAQKPPTGAPAGSNVSTQAPIPPNAEIGSVVKFKATAITCLTTQDGKPYYSISTTTGDNILTFSRALFRFHGYTDEEMDTWPSSKITIQFEQTIDAKLMERKDGSGTYYAAILPDVEKVQF